LNGLDSGTQTQIWLTALVERSAVRFEVTVLKTNMLSIRAPFLYFVLCGT